MTRPARNFVATAESVLMAAREASLLMRRAIRLAEGHSADPGTTAIGALLDQLDAAIADGHRLLPGLQEADDWLLPPERAPCADFL
ncbi:hypothetical protein [Dactylosporangium sp. NPDC051541]|uniref:hypothetical protein n=1 Tax=Dactylosporangium sp. NPDC051541 TaxID=3363977 RepID=UPI00378C3E22